MGKSWMGFCGSILQAQKSHPNPQNLPAAGSVCLEGSATSLFQGGVLPLSPQSFPKEGRQSPPHIPSLKSPVGSATPGAK